MLLENETGKIIRACMNVHGELGMGFLEAVYQEALALEFLRMQIPFEKEKALPIAYKDILLDKNYFADFLCYDSIIVELKAVAAITDSHVAQVVNYLKASKKQIGLLVNFGEKSLRWRRISAFSNPENPENPCEEKKQMLSHGLRGLVG